MYEAWRTKEHEQGRKQLSVRLETSEEAKEMAEQDAEVNHEPRPSDFPETVAGGNP